MNGKQECFDVDHKWCDWPERVDCGDRPICDENDENCDEVIYIYQHKCLGDLYDYCNNYVSK